MARRAATAPAARCVPGGGRQPRSARRRDQRPQRLSRSRTATPARTCWRRSGRRSRRPRRSAGEPAERIAAAISFGALMGARGNSGVITSQIFRGMAEGLGGKKRFNGLDLAHALSEGAKDRLRRGREAGRGHDPDGHPRVGRRGGRRGRARQRHRGGPGGHASTRPRSRSRGRRPCCAILREAGVVDSGRPGPVPAVPGRAAAPRRDRRRPAAGARPRTPTGAEAVARSSPMRDEGFGYETMFLLQADRRRAARRRRASATTSSRSASRCSSPATRRALKVHVHNERPDQVIGYGLALGTLSRISVENLDNQARDVRETRAAAFTGGAGRRAAPALGRAAAPRPRPAPAAASATRVQPRRSRSSPWPPATGWPRSSATSASPRVVQGGQTANPSTGELLEAVDVRRRPRGPAAAEQPERRPRRAPGRRR